MKQISAIVISNKHTSKTKSLTAAIYSRIWDEKYRRYFKRITKLKVHSEQVIPVNTKIMIIKTKLKSATKAFKVVSS